MIFFPNSETRVEKSTAPISSFSSISNFLERKGELEQRRLDLEDKRLEFEMRKWEANRAKEDAQTELLLALLKKQKSDE